MLGPRLSQTACRIAHSAAQLGRKLCDDEGGNTLVFVAGGVLMLMAAVGGGVDMSRAYMTKTNLQAACDAGVLAGRKAMSKTAKYETAEKAKADKMFYFNLNQKQTQSTNVSFMSESHDDGSVSGRATARTPMIIMKIFGMKSFDLAVDCSAELQMASADVMFVLDVTGSMAGTKIQGLKDAVRDFHKTVAQAVIDKDKTTIRYGFVPYSQAVNVSGLLASGAMKTSWFADRTRFPSRVAVFETPYYVAQTKSTVNSTLTHATGITQADCTAYYDATYPNSSSVVVNSGGPPPASTIVTTYTKGTWTKTSGKNVSPATGTCTYNRKVETTPYVTVYKFDRYEYKDVEFDTTGLLPGGTKKINIGELATTSGTPRYVDTPGTYDVYQLAAKQGTANNNLPGSTSAALNGCVGERATVQNYAFNPVPDNAYDYDINGAPTEDATKWTVIWPIIYWTRPPFDSSPSHPSTACPAPARQFQVVDTTSETLPSDMDAYITSLSATGSTYHDIGMLWGARLASTRGMYSANVLEGDRVSVSRHIIFMTDGQMEPTNSTYSSYGVEGQENRIAPPGQTESSSGTLAAYHNNRFLAACQKAKEEGYTIWLVGFGTTVTSVMKTCSSANRAYQANNTEELKAAFRYIAGQVADLRIKQ